MQINPYLMYTGNCVEAFNRYADIFGGEVTVVMKYGDSEMASRFSDDMQDRAMHAQVNLRGNTLMGSDVQEEHYAAPAGVHVQVALDCLEDARQIFDALASDGTVQMKFEPTFWADGFGIVRDKYSVSWMINCEKDAGA